jgi:hypothetical protein
MNGESELKQQPLFQTDIRVFIKVLLYLLIKSCHTVQVGFPPLIFSISDNVEGSATISCRVLSENMI